MTVRIDSVSSVRGGQVHLQDVSLSLEHGTLKIQLQHDA